MKPPDFYLLIASIFGLSLIGVLAIILISFLRPNIDNTVLITTVIGFLTPTLASLIAVVKSFHNANAIEELHLAVNSRLTELLQQTSLAANLAGRAAAAAAAIAEDKEIISKKDPPA